MFTRPTVDLGRQNFLLGSAYDAKHRGHQLHEDELRSAFTLNQRTTMGLFDFLSNEGEKKPVEPAAKPAAGGATDFFGNPAQPTQPAAAQGQSYTVVSGDSLSKIAKNHYGDAAKWHQIYDANKATIGSNPDHIEVGQVLTLPTI